MKKEQIITLSVCAAGGVALLAAGLVLFRGVSRYNDAARALKSARQNLENHYREPVFPSAENVQLEQSNAVQLVNWFDELAAALRAGNVNRDERSPSQFVGILERARDKMLREAQSAGTELPANFAFGFDRYTGTGTLPRPDDVPRLTEQLELVYRLSRILFDNRVKSLGIIERAIFEDAAPVAAAAAQPAAPASGRRPAAGRGHAAAATAPVAPPTGASQPGVIAQGALFGKYRFAIEFNAKETALIGILNALTANPSFTVVNVVRISKDVPVLMPAAQTPAAPAAVIPGLDAAPVPADAKSTERLGPAYPVCGLEMEIPMRVRIELDVYKFKGDSQ